MGSSAVSSTPETPPLRAFLVDAVGDSAQTPVLSMFLRSDARPQHVKDIRPGRLLTKRLQVRILFEDTDILDFEILSGCLVNRKAAFAGVK
jgi:hypothetical protein